jgi:hypothetical protein
MAQLPVSADGLLADNNQWRLCTCVQEKLLWVLAQLNPDLAVVFASEDLIVAITAAQKMSSTVLSAGPSQAKASLTAAKAEAAAAALVSAAAGAASAGPLPAAVGDWVAHLVETLRSAFDADRLAVVRRARSREKLDVELAALAVTPDHPVWGSAPVLIGATIPASRVGVVSYLCDVFAVAETDGRVVLQVPSGLSGWVMSELSARMFALQVLVLPVLPGMVSASSLRLAAELAMASSWEEALQVAATLAM